jgi:hypothetical protein
MKQEETQEEIDTRFAKAEELRFWETMYEGSLVVLLHAKPNLSQYQVAETAKQLANSSVDDRRDFIKRQKANFPQDCP